MESKTMTLPKNNDISIAGRVIGPDHAPYVICELSANHNGSLDKALEMIECGKKVGADAIKIQTYRPDTITLNSDAEEFRIKGGLWDGRTLYELYEEAHTPWEWHKPLFDKAREVGIPIFSSPFDTTAVDLLEDLNSPAYKVASFEVVDLPLIRYIASTGKPMIISTGMADAEEIGEAVETARTAGCSQMVVLHCVSGYPAPAVDYNLRTIPDMAACFDVLTGLSDHTLGTATAIASVAMGACVLEKHFTLDRNGGGPDDSFSLEPAEFGVLCRDARTAWKALGHVNYGRKSSERENTQFRRSLYFISDLEVGDTITVDAIRSVRPGFGIPPKMLEEVVGKKAARKIPANTPVQRGDWH
jgi:pseudaminic acid synthase